jgi:hypothetical protein
MEPSQPVPLPPQQTEAVPPPSPLSRGRAWLWCWLGRLLCPQMTALEWGILAAWLLVLAFRLLELWT